MENLQVNFVVFNSIVPFGAYKLELNMHQSVSQFLFFSIVRSMKFGNEYGWQYSTNEQLSRLESLHKKLIMLVIFYRFLVPLLMNYFIIYTQSLQLKVIYIYIVSILSSTRCEILTWHTSGSHPNQFFYQSFLLNKCLLIQFSQFAKYFLGTYIKHYTEYQCII